MARPREYDPEQILDGAVRAFWRSGYFDTSVNDLVQATGVQRYGLYESFGDKHGLFVAALRRYEEVWITGVLGDLETEDASLPQIFGVFERLTAPVPDGVTPAGCLMCNTAAELGGVDATADQVVSAYMERLHIAFENALRRAQERSEVRKSLDPQDHARFLAGVVVGVAVHKKTGAGQAALESFVRAALATLDPSGS